MFFRARTFARALAGYQAAAVVFGLTLVPHLTGFVLWALWTLFVAALAISSWQLWYGCASAERVFRWTQLPQVPVITLSMWGWSLYSPAMFAIGRGVDERSLSFVGQLGPTVAIGPTSHDAHFIGVNAMPLIAWWMLRHAFPATVSSEKISAPAA
jgi:hypothetical protein